MSTNPKEVITDLLKDIPAYARRTMLVGYSIAVLVLTILKIFEVDLQYDKIAEAMLVIGGYLGIQESVNLVEGPTFTESRQADDGAGETP